MLLLWYPKCSTCQKARAFLEAHGVQPALRDITLSPPTEAELTEWQAASGLPLRRFFNTSGLRYRALGLAERLPAMPEAAQRQALAGDGMLVKRPLLVGDGFVLVGFRPQEWEAVL